MMYEWFGNEFDQEVNPIEFKQLKDTVLPGGCILLPMTSLDPSSDQWDAAVAELRLKYIDSKRELRFFYGITPILNLDSLRAARQAAQNMPLVAVPVDKNKMAKGLGQVTFRPHAQSRYAFDWGTWEWYRRSMKLDPYYAPFAPNYIAPWKLVPCGETDYVTACFEGDYKKIDVNKIRFATAPDGDALEAVYDPKILGWRISLHATEHGHTYNIYALYKGQVIGKLRVVSYRAQHHTVTIVPVNNAQPDTASIERYLNRVYGPVGVRFTVHLDERMRGNVSWSAAGDGRLSLVGLDLFGNEAERRESPDMRRLQAAYAQAVGGIEAGSGCYLFVLDGESGLDPAAHLLGEMPRRSRFGYLFSPDGRGMERTIAHELGHGLFTLQHTFDDEYGGAESRGTTQNLMDYGTEADTALAAFQWNIMASPAVFTLLDDGDAGKALAETTEEIQFKRLLAQLKRMGDDHIIFAANCSGNDFNIEQKSFIFYKSKKLYLIRLNRDSGKSPELVDIDLKEMASSTLQISPHSHQVIRYADVFAMCDVDADRYPQACNENDFIASSGLKERLIEDIDGCLGDITPYLQRTIAHFDYDGVELVRNGVVHSRTPIGMRLTDEQINSGEWPDDLPFRARFSIDADGIIQLQAFGFKPSAVANRDGKSVDHKKVAENIRHKTNALFRANRVTDLGSIHNAETETFADGGRISIGGTFAKIFWEGIEITKTLLKTGEVEQRVYLTSSNATIKAPGLVTGSLEVVAQKVTDITSLGVLVYDIATDEATRSSIKQQFKEIKDQIGDNPNELFPVLRDVILVVATGNTPEEWNKSLNSPDSGERSHLATRGTGNVIVSVATGAAIVKSLPDAVEKLSESVKKVKRISQTLEDFAAKTLPEKIEDISNLWKTKRPLNDMFEGRHIFEDIMGEYRYRKADGWAHTADIADNFKGVDFYKGIEIDGDIDAQIAVSMKTTATTDVNKWLYSKPIQDNIRFLKEGLDKAKGITSHNKKLFFDTAEIHIYVPKENIHIKDVWLNVLAGKHSEIVFKIDILENYIK